MKLKISWSRFSLMFYLNKNFRKTMSTVLLGAIGVPVKLRGIYISLNCDTHTQWIRQNSNRYRQIVSIFWKSAMNWTRLFRQFVWMSSKISYLQPLEFGGLTRSSMKTIWFSTWLIPKFLSKTDLSGVFFICKLKIMLIHL